MKNRPVGVTIFGWYLIITAVVYFLTILLFAFSKLPIIDLGWNTFAPIIWIGAIFVGKGLLNLQEWARKVIIWWFAIVCLLIPLAVFIGIKITHPKYAGGIIIAFVALFYFTRPKVKEQFK